jgi:hypothetical protein
MAERVIRQIIDDIDKSEIAEGEGERIEFTFRGVAYQLDLSNANVAKLEKALAPFIDAATSASSGIEGSTSAAAERPSPRRRRAAKKTAVRQRAASSDQGLGERERLLGERPRADPRRCCRGVSDGTSAISPPAGAGHPGQALTAERLFSSGKGGAKALQPTGHGGRS